MSVTLPYPDKPANGQSPDATPILANLLALLAAINAFDGTAINAKTVTEPALADQVNPRLRDAGSVANFIESGGYTAAFAGLSWTMPSGVEWYNGYRNAFAGAGYSVGLNSDTYYSVDQNGTINAPQVVGNGAAAPAVPANSQFLAKVISGAAAISSIQDMRNLSPVKGSSIVQTLANAGTGGGTMFYVNLGGLKLLWGASTTGLVGGGASYGITLPAGFFSTIQMLNVGSGIIGGASSDMRVSLQAYTTAAFSFFLNGTAQGQAQFFIIGT